MKAYGRITGGAIPRKTETLTVLNTFGHDYKLILVGDATMSPYEITYPGGSVEHFNPEAGRGLAGSAVADLATGHLVEPTITKALELRAVHPDGAGADG
jgi:hypothetical protein